MTLNTTSIEVCGLCASVVGPIQVYSLLEISSGVGITLISLYPLLSFPKACLSCQATHHDDIITQNKASGFRGHCIMIGRKQDYYQLIQFFFCFGLTAFFRLWPQIPIFNLLKQTISEQVYFKIARYL